MLFCKGMLFLYHMMLGIGYPVTEQVNLISSPCSKSCFSFPTFTCNFENWISEQLTFWPVIYKIKHLHSYKGQVLLYEMFTSISILLGKTFNVTCFLAFCPRPLSAMIVQVPLSSILAVDI